MDCKTSSALIMSYVDETIEEIEWADLQEHMRVCSKCQEEFDVFTEMLGLIEEMPLDEPSLNFEDKIMESINHSLYTTTAKKWIVLNPLIISLGVYITFAIMFLQEKGHGNLVGWIGQGSKLLKQMSLIGNLAQKIIIGGYEVFVAYPLRGLQGLIELLSWSPINFLLTYGISLGVLLILLKIIKATLMELLKMDGGDLEWRKINLEK